MKPWQFAVVGLALLATAGCRSDPAIPILERRAPPERRRNLPPAGDPGRLPGLRSSRARSGRRRPDRHRDGGAGSRARRVAGRLRRAERRRSRRWSNCPRSRPPKCPTSLKTPAGSLPPGVPDVPEELQARRSRSVRPKTAAVRPTTDRRPTRPNPTVRRWKGGAASDLSTRRRVTMASQSASAVPFTPSGDSRRVAAIVLNRTLTGGISAGDRSGDQGLLVVVEPRDRAGRTVDAPADMSVVVLDPALQGRCRGPRGPLGLHRRRNGRHVPPHRLRSGDPPDDGLARRSADAQQAAPVRPLRHGRRAEAAGRSADRGGVAGRQDGPMDAQRPARGARAVEPRRKQRRSRLVLPAPRRTWPLSRTTQNRADRFGHRSGNNVCVYGVNSASASSPSANRASRSAARSMSSSEIISTGLCM